MDDKVEESMFQQKFAALGSKRKFFFDEFLNNPWACKAYQGAGLAHNDIPKHCK